jgi:hypothetical protein
VALAGSQRRIRDLVATIKARRLPELTMTTPTRIEMA